MFQPDFIIVGAGSAGCVMAEVLSRNPNNKVLVVEAGGSGRLNPWIDIPLGFGKTFGDPKVNWCIDTAVDSGLGRAQYWPRGKVWGGSSSINGLVWIRPFRSDIDGWQSAAGFGWSDLVPHFDAIEARTGGGIPVEDPGPWYDDADQRLHKAYFDSAASLQIPRKHDFDQSMCREVAAPCVGHYYTNTRNARRVGGREAFLNRAIKRANCKIVSNFEAHSLVMAGVKVVGVRDGKGQELRAGKEVILSGGAIGSPTIMLRSGLGQLLPHLGQNLSDHLGINFIFKSRVKTMNSKLNSSAGRVWAGMQYVFARRGPLAVGINPAGGFIKTDPELAEPNFQLYLQALTTSAKGFMKEGTGERPILEPDDFDAFAMGLSTCRPKSVGEITLNADGSTNIQPNSFSHPDDMPEFVEAVKFIRKLAGTKPIADLVEHELVPGAAVPTDDEALAQDIRNRCGTVYHPACTVRVGQDASDGVVDGKGRVFGVQGLRVVDASIFRTQLSVNLNATTMALSHKIASEMLAQ